MEIVERTVIIPCAGKGSRMGDTIRPKALSIIKNKPALEHLLQSMDKYFSKFYVVINDLKSEEEIYRNNLSGPLLRKVCFVKSIAGQGDGQAVLDALSTMNFKKRSSHVMVCWGDTYINSPTLLNKLLNTIEENRYNECFIAPVRKVKDPYVTYLTDEGEKLKRVAFSRKGEFFNQGHTDISMFFIDTKVIYEALNDLKDQVKVIGGSKSELNFLDLVEFFYKKNTPTRIFEINDINPVLSFNTVREAESINKKH